jgi:hypothetical protein
MNGVKSGVDILEFTSRPLSGVVVIAIIVHSFGSLLPEYASRPLSSVVKIRRFTHEVARSSSSREYTSIGEKSLSAIGGFI